MIKCVKSGIAVLFSAMMLCILTLVVGCFDQIAFAGKRVFLLGQGTMLLCGMACLSVLAWIVMHRRTDSGVRRRDAWKRLLCWMVLFGTQLVLCFHAYFMPGWDVGAVLDAAYYAAGADVYINEGYFSMYPNNIPLVMFFSVIIRLLRFVLGSPGLDRCVFVIIAVQCLLNTFTGMLCSEIIRKETGSDGAACFTAIVYSMFVGLSPWLMVPYSDSMVLVFPTLTLALYQRFRDRHWVWPVIGVVCALGYMIKPQAVIVFIAVVIVEFIRTMNGKTMGSWLRVTAGAALMLVLVVFSGGHMLKSLAPMEINPEKNMGMLHFAMMGLNTETNGVYSDEDVVFSATIGSAEERKTAQWQEIKKRLSVMSADDLLDHLKKKTLTNYADGTFAWGQEGNFFKQWIEDKDEHLSPFLKRIIHTDHEYYLILQTYCQCIWLALLLGCLIYAVLTQSIQGEISCVVMLSLLGLTAFELIFEARARYLYLYAPFYITLGVQGIWMIIWRMRGKRDWMER